MTKPALRQPLHRRTALGAAAWTAPVIAVVAATPAYAASGPATALQRVDPTAASFSVGSASRTVRTRLVNGTTPVVGATVSFTLVDASFVTFPGGATSTVAVTDSAGLASVALVPVAGATPVMGTSVVLDAGYQSTSLSWTVTYARVDLFSAGSEALHRILTSGGEPYAFGFNAIGQLGDGTTDTRLAPVRVRTTTSSLAGRTVTIVAAGSYHSVAVASDTTLHAWGDNFAGQVGDGTNDNRSTPVLVPTAGTSLAGRTVTAVATGYGHTIVIADGTVHAWGYNFAGELGDGTTTSRNAPVAVVTAGTSLAGKTVVDVAAGYEHSVALASDGTIHTWGANYGGQLGDGTTVDRSRPVAVAVAGTPLAGKTVIAVAASAEHSMALASDGTVHAWGLNQAGQLGNGTGTNSPVPVAVAVATVGSSTTGKTITAIACGYRHSVALASDGTVHGWGYNRDGQLGDGTTTDRRVPVAVVTAGTPMAGKTVTRITAGESQSYAISDDQLAFSWGGNLNGQLGNGTTTSSTSPTQVAGLPTGPAARPDSRRADDTRLPPPGR